MTASLYHAIPRLFTMTDFTTVLPFEDMPQVQTVRRMHEAHCQAIVNACYAVLSDDVIEDALNDARRGFEARIRLLRQRYERGEL